ncbi:hypothetical protein KR067_007327 [Drosophila pandora]|nr:hypothetical protein KR067_007327 [Drosophila pandora]
MDANKEPPKPPQQNAATGFGLEDHEATGADPRVNAFRTGEDKRRASLSSKSQTRIHPQNTANNPDQRVKNIQEEHFRRYRSQMSIASMNPSAVPDPPPKPVRSSETESSGTDRNQDTLGSDVPQEVNNEGRKVEPETEPGVEMKQVSIKVDPETEPLLPPPPPPAPAPAAAPEPARKSLDIAPKQEFTESPQRPEDLPLPPPTMPAGDDEKCMDLDEKDDAESSLSKLTNTDVTFDPSKAYACKGTNTSPDPSGLIYTEAEDSDTDVSDEEEENNLPDVVPAENLDQLFLLACREVRSVGSIALTESNKDENKQIANRSPNQHAISPAGNAVEELFIEAISSRYPDHKFIAEEKISRSEDGICNLTDDPTWIIDPIDGTVNYVHQFPYYCISVAYLVNKQTQFGIIYNPPMKNMYTAQLGKGAKMNRQKIKTTGQRELSNALVLQDYGTAGNDERRRAAKANADTLSGKVQALRDVGSPAMCLALVASGVADAYFNFGLHCWDMAAGVLIVTEAGGVAMDPANTDLDIMARRCLAASSEHLALQLGNSLQQIYPRPRDDEAKASPDEMASEMRDFSAQTDFPETEESSSSDPNKD